MNKILASVSVLTSVLCGSALADSSTITFQKAMVSVDVPEGWHSSSEGGIVSLWTDRNEASMVLGVVPVSRERHPATLAKSLGMTNIKLNAEHGASINGMDGVAVEATGMLNGVFVNAWLYIIDTPSADRDLTIIALEARATAYKHNSELAFLWAHINPTD